MSYARHKASGEVPEEIYVVSYGSKHKIYSKLSAARGVYTTDKKWYPDIKILKAIVTGYEELDYESPERDTRSAWEKQQERRDRAEYERLKRMFEDA